MVGGMYNLISHRWTAQRSIAGLREIFNFLHPATKNREEKMDIANNQAINLEGGFSIGY